MPVACSGSPCGCHRRSKNIATIINKNATHEGWRYMIKNGTHKGCHYQKAPIRGYAFGMPAAGMVRTVSTLPPANFHMLIGVMTSPALSKSHGPAAPV